MASKAYICNETEDISVSNWRFITSKYFNIFPYFAIAILFSFIMHHIVVPTNLGVIAHDAIYTFPELLCLQMLGFPGYWATGVSWYLSAMLICMFVLYPCVVKLKNKFTLIIAPFVSIFIYGYFAYTFINVNTPDFWIGFVYKGILRALAGICLGCFSFSLSQRFKKYKLTPLTNFIAVLGFAIVLMLTFTIKYEGYADYLMILFLFISITISFSQNDGSIIIRGNKLTNFLGILSISLFLNHYYWAVNITKIFPSMSQNHLLLLYILISFATALLNYSIVIIIRKLNLTNFKRLFIRQT